MIKLRDFEVADQALLVLYLNNKAITQFVTGAIPQPYTPEDAAWWVSHSNNTQYIKAIEFKGVFVGCISATRGEFEYSCGAELGYWIGEAYWNKGIATKAIEQFSYYLFETHHIARLFVSVVSLNKASIKALEHNGYTLDGVVKKASYKNGQFYDEYIISKLNSSIA